MIVLLESVGYLLSSRSDGCDSSQFHLSQFYRNSVWCDAILLLIKTDFYVTVVFCLHLIVHL